MQDDNKPAIVFRNVTKHYRLGGGLKEHLLEAIGFRRKSAETLREFMALDDVSFELGRGQRLGLIGRNGAGKTTLLKLISGNYRPTRGQIEVNGSVQALMTMGQGFHPDYSGRENIKASLHYNGLSNHEVEDAFEDVIDFCELGPFLDEPFKNYSSGMQSRLMFATATAIKPDVLIIDEVLGAGDAYFLAKSKQRVERIVGGGCTLLLVSHAMGQVLELCENAIWMEGGRIKEIGNAFAVVKSYEESIYGAIPGSGDPSSARRQPRIPNGTGSVSSKVEMGETVVASWASTQNASVGLPRLSTNSIDAGRMQVPAFIPNSQECTIPRVPESDGRTYRNVETTGISKWGGEPGLKISGFTISGPLGPTDRLVSLQPAMFTVFLEVEETRSFNCTYGLAVNDLQGRCMARFFGPSDCFEGVKGMGRQVDIFLNPNQLGPGIYTIGISIHDEAPLEDIANVARYDLINRSFSLVVELPDSLASASAGFFHTSEWSFRSVVLPDLANILQDEDKVVGE